MVGSSKRKAMKNAKFSSVSESNLRWKGKYLPPCKEFINLEYARCPVLYVRCDDGRSAARNNSITTSARLGTACVFANFVTTESI